MKKERKELLKKFKEVVADLLDNYEKYTDAERKQIKEVFDKVAALNKILDKYDIEYKANWFEFIQASSQYFEGMDY